MNPESYQKLKNVLIQAGELPVEEQTQFVKYQLKQYPQLIDMALKMLISGSDNEAQIFSNSIVEKIFGVAVQKDIDCLQPGTEINHYLIDKVIGSGGMGVVYAAKQIFPAERKVAIKLIKDLPNQKQLISETQMLAKLNHPNIATLYEINETPDGQLYLVMELLEGEDIVSWCRNNKYNLKNTLHLFNQLCNAIDFAHQKGVIHCDIKPNNVLVTQIDGVDTVKVIDFGISRFEDVKSDTIEISGTISYLAPEILEQDEQYINDTRRDVYALGVLLKKLLPENSDNDLKAIMEKAIEKNPENRYATPAQISEDIRLYSLNRAISARKHTYSYLLRLFLRRRYGAVIISLLLLATLIGAYLFQIRQAEAARLAQSEAEEVSAFLIDLFNVANPEKSGNEEITAISLLDTAKDKLLQKKSLTLSDARFLHTIGSIYTKIGKLNSAKEIIEKSLQVRASYLPENDKQIIQSYIQLGLLEKNLKNPEDSEKYLFKARDLLIHSDHTDNSQLAYVHNHLGNLYFSMLELDKAQIEQEKAVKLRKKIGDKKLLADSYNNLGVIYRERNDFANTSKYMNLALHLYIQEYGRQHPFVGIVKNNLSKVEESARNFDKAEQLLRDSYSIFKNKYGLKHYNTITSFSNLHSFYYRRMQYQKATELFNSYINEVSIDDLLTPRLIFRVLEFTSMEALTYAKNSEFEQSIKLHKKTIEYAEKATSDAQFMIEKMHTRYARSLMEMNQLVEAMQQIDLALNINLQKHASENNMRFYIMNLKAENLFQQNKIDEAKRIYLGVASGSGKDSNIEIEKITALIKLSKIYLQTKETEKMQQVLDQAMSLNQTIKRKSEKVRATIFYQYAQLELMRGGTLVAEEMLQKALNIQKAELPPKHPDLLDSEKLFKKINSMK